MYIIGSPIGKVIAKANKKVIKPNGKPKNMPSKIAMVIFKDFCFRFFVQGFIKNYQAQAPPQAPEKKRLNPSQITGIPTNTKRCKSTLEHIFIFLVLAKQEQMKNPPRNMWHALFFIPHSAQNEY